MNFFDLLAIKFTLPSKAAQPAFFARFVQDYLASIEYYFEGINPDQIDMPPLCDQKGC